MKGIVWWTAVVSCIPLALGGLRTLGQTPEPSRAPQEQSTPAPADSSYESFGIYANTAPRPSAAEPVATSLPLALQPGDRIALIGNTLFERSQLFGQFEALLHRQFPEHRLVVRHLAWSADAIGLQPRPDNFADTEQHLTHERADVILAAFGFNESFSGPTGLAEFQHQLQSYVRS